MTIEEIISISRPIKGYENEYMISPNGEVVSLERYVEYPNGVKQIVRTKILKNLIDTQGYLRVGLYKKAKAKSFSLHRLVAQAFLLNPLNLPEVDHLDNNPKNCSVSNLEWVTASENNKRAYQRGRKVPWLGRIGKKCPNSKKVNQIKDGIVIKTWDAMMDAEREEGFRHSNIVACIKGRKKTAYGFKWEYVNGA